MLLTVCVLLAPTAWASWSTLKSTGAGTLGVGNPSCAAIFTGHVVCAALSAESAMTVSEFNGTTWGAWKSLTGAVSSIPSCTGDGAGNVLCAATAADGGLLNAIFNGAAWSTPTELKATLYSAPSCAEYKAGKVLCAARNASGGLAWMVYNGTQWSGVGTLATTAAYSPSYASDQNGGVVCAVPGDDGTTQVNRYVSGAWEGFLNLGGWAVGGAVQCAYNSPAGEVTCYQSGTNNALYINSFNGGNWSTGWDNIWFGLGGLMDANANCISQSVGEYLCTMNGIGSGTLQGESGLNSRVWNGSSWSGWINIGTAGIGSPSCAPLGNGEVVCVVRQVNNLLYSSVGP